MKSFDNIIEGVQRSRRLKVASGQARTRLQGLTRKQQTPCVFDKIANLFRRGEEKKQLETDISSLQGRIPELERARDVAIAKVDRRQLSGYQRKDMSTDANRLRQIMGLRSSVGKYQERLKTETNPEKKQNLERKISKIQRNIGQS